MHNWLKQTLLAGTILVSSLQLKSQTIETLINRMHENQTEFVDANKEIVLTKDEMIKLALKNSVDVHKKLIRLEETKIHYVINKHNRTMPRIVGHLNSGYDLKQGLIEGKGFDENPIYPEANVSFSIPLYNPDNKYSLKLSLNEIDKEKIGLLYAVSNIMRSSSETYLNILNLNNHLKTLNQEKTLIDSLMNYQTDSQRLNMIRADLESQDNKVEQQIQTIIQTIENQKTNLRRSFGWLSQTNIVLKDSLELPPKDLFDSPNFNPETIGAYEDTLSACASLIRIQIEKIDIENAVINYAKKKNFEFNLSMSSTFRNSVIPTPYFGMPLGLGIRFDIFGNNKREEEQLAELKIQEAGWNIENTVRTIAPNIKTVFEEMLLRIDLASEKNKNIYQEQLSNLINLYFSSDSLTEEDKRQVNKLPSIIDQHFNSILKYYDNITIANKKAEDVKKMVLYSTNPLKWALVLEQDQLSTNFSNKEFRKEIRPKLLKHYQFQKKHINKDLLRPSYQTPFQDKLFYRMKHK